MIVAIASEDGLVAGHFGRFNKEGDGNGQRKILLRTWFLERT